MLLAPGIALLPATCPPALGQSRVEANDFDPVAVVNGIRIDRATCAALERDDTAIWVEADGQASCLRYYAAGLAAENPVAALWLNGDVLGPRGNDASRRQSGFGPAAMVAQEEALSRRFGVPFIFLGRPGTYGSAGHHHSTRGRPVEAALVDAALNGLKTRYRVGAWALGGHSGGGTLVAEMLARRHDLRCAVISSGAASYRAYLEARGLARPGERLSRFDPSDSIVRIPVDPGRRVFVIGDPRETNVPFATQRLYAERLVAQNIATWLVPLQRATDARHHGLVDFGETATGLCAAGADTPTILHALAAMPEQAARRTN
ncbi:alpha/beta hydrolase [Roseomonas sp. HJA6]|uniref:Alpha/beta hydrolase n=1 Tax=Roseomonas alba TaxID=2846776 RepID=A0ABS7ABQ6_9PROT|nr:alpha/beta hydrolase [Neoroseomonas alba]MBW6399723.1 alpha/beta hydrolase [Neoroseomonas alba]